MTEKDTFEAYCAPCHGRGGAGDGPVATFRSLDSSDVRVRIRIQNVVDFLQSLQQ